MCTICGLSFFETKKNEHNDGQRAHTPHTNTHGGCGIACECVFVANGQIAKGRAKRRKFACI